METCTQYEISRQWSFVQYRLSINVLEHVLFIKKTPVLGGWFDFDVTSKKHDLKLTITNKLNVKCHHVKYPLAASRLHRY